MSHNESIPPERIHITFNASDGWDRFEEIGITDTHLAIPGPEKITQMLQSNKGKLFRIMGWREDSAIEVVLSVQDCSLNKVQCLNHALPHFCEWYMVAEQPLPARTVHGDYLFDLVTA